MSKKTKWVTNYWSRIETGQHRNSLIGLDFYPTSSRPEIKALDNLRYQCIFQDAALNMPESNSAPRDGLIREIKLDNKGPINSEHPTNQVVITIILEHPTEINYEIKAGCPEQVIIKLDRSPLKKILMNKLIIIDPAHGGQDLGAVSPTSLPEKEVTLDIAKRMKIILEKYGAAVVLLRTQDTLVSDKVKQSILVNYTPDLVISLHTGNNPNGKVIGPRTGFINKVDSFKGKTIATTMQKALSKKLIFPDGGIFSTSNLLLRKYPDNSLLVEISNITSRLEEGWMRDHGFRDIMALALFYGIKKIFHFHLTPPQP